MGKDRQERKVWAIRKQAGWDIQAGRTSWRMTKIHRSLPPSDPTCLLDFVQHLLVDGKLRHRRQRAVEQAEFPSLEQSCKI